MTLANDIALIISRAREARTGTTKIASEQPLESSVGLQLRQLSVKLAEAPARDPQITLADLEAFLGQKA